MEGLSYCRTHNRTRCLVGLGATRALELGPGQVVAGLVKRIDRTLSVVSVGDPEGVKKAAGLVGRRPTGSDWLAGQSAFQA